MCSFCFVSLQAGGIVDKVKVAAEDKNAEGGLFAVKALAETKDATAEAYVVAMLPIVLDKYADKVHIMSLQHCFVSVCIAPMYFMQTLLPGFTRFQACCRSF